MEEGEKQEKRHMRKAAKGFFDFIREQGVVGLAIGFILGGSITVLIKSLVDDILNPIIGLMLGKAKDFSQYAIHVHGATISWGIFVNNLINFIIIAAVVYFGFKLLGLDKLDKKKEDKK